MKTAEKLKKLRKEKNISQETVAEEIGISISALRNYENENKNRIPKNEILQAFAEYYKVSSDYLLNENVQNKSIQNINIGEKFGFSDRVIEILLDLRDNSESLNYFIENIKLKKLILKIKFLKDGETLLLEKQQNVRNFFNKKRLKLTKLNKEELLNYFNEMNATIIELYNLMYEGNCLYERCFLEYELRTLNALIRMYKSLHNVNGDLFFREILKNIKTEEKNLIKKSIQDSFITDSKIEVTEEEIEEIRQNIEAVLDDFKFEIENSFNNIRREIVKQVEEFIYNI